MHIDLNLPEQTTGEWSIKNHFRNDIKYQQLFKGDYLMMDNTPEIVEGFEDFLNRASGSILINGLGIGMCCQFLLEKSNVTDLIVIEYEKSIYNLISPHFHDNKRCIIIHDNAFKYEPPKGKFFDFVWHDIWTVYTSKNLAEMDILFQKYENISGWQGAWNRQKCIELKEREERSLKIAQGEF